MTKDEIIEIINSITANSKYKRVNATHPLELYLGKTEDGYPTLRYNGQFNPIKVIGSNLIEIKQVKTSTYLSILFTYKGRDNKEIFYSFCEDMINQSETYSGNDGYVEIVNRFNQWKKMFHTNSKDLNENEIMGLIGELLFLKDDCIAIYGEGDAIKGWSGPEPTHKDFSFGDMWYEVKTINSSKNSIMISSIEQLDSNTDGKLVVYVLEKMSPNYLGVTLNSLVSDILKILRFDSDRDLFIEKLKNVGYVKNDNYDNFVYALIKRDIYKVSSGFPSLKAQNLPNGIGKVQYEILISKIEEYKEKYE